MIRTLDLVTGSNLKNWLQRDNPLRSEAAQATTQTQVKQNLLSNCAPKSRVAEKRKVEKIQHEEQLA